MDDHARVAELLGRTPRGDFEVVVRDASGDPIVVRNAPFLGDGTPMPTRYYLVGTELVRAVSRLEAAGGVRAAEAEIGAEQIAATHRRYAAERDQAITTDHTGPRPSGGVGGTRVGVKCLHAHVAYALAGGDDPVGRWALARIEADVAVAALASADPGTSATPHGPEGTDSPTLVAEPGTVAIDVADRIVTVTRAGGPGFELPVGPLALRDGPLGDADPPSPIDLTNALGLVHDHLDDVVIADPAVGDPTQVVVTGSHATMLARVEIGRDSVPGVYELARADADEVFRTLATEAADDRRHNPGLAAGHVESIVGTCCVILGIMRRLDLASVTIMASGGDTPLHDDSAEDGR